MLTVLSNIRVPLSLHFLFIKKEIDMCIVCLLLRGSGTRCLWTPGISY